MKLLLFMPEKATGIRSLERLGVVECDEAGNEMQRPDSRPVFPTRARAGFGEAAMQVR